MAVKLRTLKNVTAVAQAFVYEGQQVILGPSEEKIYTDDVAKAFLQASSPYIKEVEVEKIGSIYKEKDDFSSIWVANVTGNPDGDATSSTKVWLNKQWQDVSKPNPKLKPITVVRRMGGGQKGFDLPGEGYGSINLPALEIIIPAYQRRELPYHVGEWMLNRDACQDRAMVGCLIRSRPRSAFEPDSTWDLDDMRAYLQLCDPQANLGLQEDAIAAAAEKNNEVADIAVHKAKVLCLKRLHFRLVNPQYRLPTKKEFDDFKRGYGEHKTHTLTGPEAVQKVKDAQKQLRK